MVKSTRNTTIREKNIEAILNLLFEENLSASQIARKLKLSKTAVSNILTEMEEINLVSNIANNGADLDKYQRSLYAINKTFAAIAIIEFGSVYINIAFAYLNGEVFMKEKISDQEFLDLNSLNIVVDKYEEMKKTIPSNVHVPVCVISSPGQINRYTDDIINSVKFNKIAEINIRTWFSEKFKIPIILKNDMNLAIIGETELSANDKAINNALLVYIDSGIGGAIINNGKLVDGDDGFAAEFGLIKTFDNFGNHLYYDLICSINSIKSKISYRKNLGEKTIISDGFRYRDVVEAFHQEDELTVDVVKYTAKKIGQLISDLYNIFNYRNIYIGGRIKLMGEKYLNIVKENINKDLDSINLEYTRYDDESIFYGAIILGSKYIFKNINLLVSE